MPSDQFPKSMKRKDIPPEIQKAIGAGTDSMTVDQKRHYDERASIYDQQDKLPHRKGRLRRMDEHYYRELEKLLQPGGLTYLDFGCGTGKHTMQFLGGLKNNNVTEGYGIDYSGKLLELAAPRLPEFKFTEGSSEKIDFENKFDLVTSFFDVLGHLNDAQLELFFQNVFRALKPGGILCFEVQRRESGDPEYYTYVLKDPDDPDESILVGSDGQPLIGSMRTFYKEKIVDLAKKSNLEILELDAHIEDPAEFTVILRKK